MLMNIFSFTIGIYYSYSMVHALYKPEWDSLGQRPLPQWYDEAKVGIFIHWGIYSVPGFKTEWFWYYWKNDDKEILKYMEQNFSNIYNYKQFAPMFTAELFEPDEWAELFANAGARYVVLTTKHHDGFALFPSGIPNWNSVDIGPKKDLVDMISKSVRKYNMKFGAYYSLYEWYNRLHLDDKNCNCQYFYNNCSVYTDMIVIPHIKQILNNYNPSVLWSDGENSSPYEYWKSPEILAWIYNESPVKDEIVVNDRWGLGTHCRRGDFFNCEDRFNPKKLMGHKWENAFNVDLKSWGFRGSIMPDEIMDFKQLLETVVVTVSYGGNALINVGPSKEGIIPTVYQELLLKLGDWLKLNGEAIYGTSPWFHQNDSSNSNVWYTCKKEKYNPWRTSHVPSENENVKAIFAIFLEWPVVDNVLKVNDLKNYLEKRNYKMYLLQSGNNTSLHFNITSDKVAVYLPNTKSAINQYAWVLKIIDSVEV